MALDKQLIHVFSSPSTWKKSLFLQVRWILTPRPTLKRTKKKKTTPFPDQEAIYRQMSFSSFDLCMSFFFFLFSQSALNVAD